MKSKEILAKIDVYFSGKPEITTVIVYGSLADGRFSKSSDVDIAIAADVEIGYERLVEMNIELQNILSRDVDLVDLNGVQGLIHYQIMTKGLRLKFVPSQIAEHMIQAIYFHEDFLPQLNELSRRRIENVING